MESQTKSAAVQQVTEDGGTVLPFSKARQFGEGAGSRIEN